MKVYQQQPKLTLVMLKSEQNRNTISTLFHMIIHIIFTIFVE